MKNEKEIALAQHRELDLGVMELCDVGALAVCGLDGHSLDDVDLV